ncbi:cbb3-type cytochrome oxidase assembly protein CcoS [Aliidiomarina maris]|uniref:Cbb3-type cytochrome oxidase assembly protein CcoS n=1 Tax=Aliidiomarina maris TaxID=531312 RepID=A0A327WZ88_9GAMM|nr:cbb3-type cytochrome oxidase assembly protein CcoS [Aliidiomarina maris]MCL5051500.1 cbb3-type cytochrome oxidase assembly protein CcoS [Bacillota bacterium]RAJ98915.1 cbb3-type cytochrome oxidase maturation protein [Aliidiomarina maris]RUO25058.1 cbb3-type cytochrome oxidase assembly protein CcoS [Aliidiomarina maris]
MEILHIAVPAAILLVAFAIAIFWWAVKHGQFDDLERQGMNILLDEEPRKKKSQHAKDVDKDEADKANTPDA